MHVAPNHVIFRGVSAEAALDDELVRHWERLANRFGNADDLFVTSLLGVTRLSTPEILVMLEATAVA